MRKRASPEKLFIVFASALIATMLTGFLGAPAVRVLKKSIKAQYFWLSGLLVSLALWIANAHMMAVYVGSIWMTLGVYAELEIKGLRWWYSGILGICAGATVAVSGLVQVLSLSGITNWERARSYGLEVAEKVVATAGATGKIHPDILLQQTPSALVIVLIFALGFSLIFERQAFSVFGLPQKRVAAKINIAEFRMPDFFIWVALSSFFFAMVDIQQKEVAIVFGNVMNVVVVLYFFQGIAVFEALLNFLKAGLLTRVLGYMIMVGQLMLILSVVGLADYWMDFRRKLSRIKLPSEVE